MNCIKCGAENPDDANFCSKCGSELPLTVTNSVLENQIINNCYADNKNRKGIKVALTVVAAIVMIFIGFYLAVKNNSGLHEKHLEKDVAAIESELFNNGGTKISDIVDAYKDTYTQNDDTNSLDDDYDKELTEDQQYTKTCYTNLRYFNEEYLSDDKLTNSEKDLLISTLDTLIQALKDEQINNMTSALSIYSDSSFMDTMTDFTVEHFKILQSSHDVITSYWDKICKGENITTEDKESFEKEMNYLETLSIKE
ncbi:MAG: zinc ribbon domain-containing protein [Ruminococcus sp.]|nr:zinc ribbon domain-containing protein [Ruminococcus sp.]